MTYTASLDGESLDSGSLQQVRTAVAKAVTDLVAQDPEGASLGAQAVNLAFYTGSVAKAVEIYGSWCLGIGSHSLVVAREV